MKHKHERERRQDRATKAWRGPQAKVKLPIPSWLASVEEARHNPSQRRQPPPRCYPACVPGNAAGLLSEGLHLLPFPSPSVFSYLLVPPLPEGSKADTAAKKTTFGLCALAAAYLQGDVLVSQVYGQRRKHLQTHPTCTAQAGRGTRRSS